ncbi:TPA: repressor LexA [Candidatus Dojkabacteria bacterium]|uniref:Repressor LexA n=1 Tax=Candidatus Dojkabacteria bacterium TaxID=2099670 RepID=A0A832QDI7_9BACT|nr:repressor LexA [Candidatus Dojkabacteria bacterium]
MDGILTKKQEAVLGIIKRYYLEQGVAPSLNELKDELGITTKRGVVVHLDALEKKGYIFRTSQPRGIHMAENDDEIVYDYLVGVPILGYANAGIPMVSAEEENIGVLKIDKNILGKRRNLFSLIIKGDSMDQAVIDGHTLKNGKYVVVEKDADFEDGDIVVAIIDNCATIKRFKRGRDMIVLYPDSSNPANTPIYIDKNTDILINGKVVKVLENPAI